MYPNYNWESGSYRRRSLSDATLRAVFCAEERVLQSERLQEQFLFQTSRLNFSFAT